MKNRISGYVSYCDAYCVSIKWKVAYRSRLLPYTSRKSKQFTTSRLNNSYQLINQPLREGSLPLFIINPLSLKKKKKEIKLVPISYIYSSLSSLVFTVLFRYRDILLATNISKLHDRYTSHRYTVPTQKTLQPSQQSFLRD